MYPQQNYQPFQENYPVSSMRPMAPMGQGGYANNSYMMNSFFNNYMNFIYVPDPMAELAQTTTILIKQEPDYDEKISGTNSLNRYHVWANKNGQITYLFKCQERTNSCCKNLCPASSWPISMDIKHLTNPQDWNGDFTNPFATLDKKSNICGKEDMLVKVQHNLYGKVLNVGACCGQKFFIKNSSGDVRFNVTSGCLCFVGDNEFVFDIKIGEDSDKDAVGRITKRKTEIQEKGTDATSFSVEFPDMATPEEKLCLIANTLLIDYCLFEDNAFLEKLQKEIKKANVQGKIKAAAKKKNAPQAKAPVSQPQPAYGHGAIPHGHGMGGMGGMGQPPHGHGHH